MDPEQNWTFVDQYPILSFTVYSFACLTLEYPDTSWHLIEEQMCPSCYVSFFIVFQQVAGYSELALASDSLILLQSVGFVIKIHLGYVTIFNRNYFDSIRIDSRLLFN